MDTFVDEYPDIYKFEPHAHTAESSACSGLPAEELVEMYFHEGFGGIAITDHLYEYLLMRHNDDWDACIDYLLRGYKAAKQHGDKLGIDVILGMELSFANRANDYLVYGFDEDFLRKNPFLPLLTSKEFFQRYGNELLIIQAHPSRDGNTLDTTGSVHGIEVYNSNPRHNNHNGKTKAYHKANPKLLATSASDAHQPEDVGRGWIELDAPVADSYRFRDLVKARRYTLGIWK